jgi:hypothetical protein
MTDLLEELLPLERALAAGGGDAYRARLTADAVLVVPGQVLDRDATIAAMDASAGWDAFAMEGPRVIPLGTDAAVLTYTFTGRRGDLDYRAVLASAYRREGGAWRLAFHQQTPLPG